MADNSHLNLVAVDNGYADQKIAFWQEDEHGNKEIKTMLLPSRAQMGAVNISIDGKSAGVYELEGDYWTVGKDVSSPESIRSDRYAHSGLNTVLVNHSLRAAGFSGKDVHLATGLPFSHFFKESEPNISFQDKVKNALRTPVSSRDGEKMAVIQRHSLYPESSAAFVDYATNDKGEMIIHVEFGIAVVDIGGNTTDITCISSENRIDTERSGSTQLGVLDVRKKLGKLIRDKFSIDELKDSQLDKALRTNICQIFGKQEDVSELIDQAKRQTVNKLMLYVTEKVGDASDMDKIIFVGGGAEILGDIIQEYPHSFVPENPQFSNARGMLKYMTFMDN